MLKTKKLYRLMAGLLAALMICASVPSVAYATEGGAATVKVQMYLNTDGRELEISRRSWRQENLIRCLRWQRQLAMYCL